MRPARGAAARLRGTPCREPEAIRVSEPEIAVEETWAKAKVGQKFAAPITAAKMESPVSGAFPVAGAGLNLRPPDYAI